MQNTNNACEDWNKANEIIIDVFDDALANSESSHTKWKRKTIWTCLEVNPRPLL